MDQGKTLLMLNDTVKQLQTELKAANAQNVRDRKDLWRNIACAVVNANDCKHTSTAIAWADQIVAVYDKKFPDAVSGR